MDTILNEVCVLVTVAFALTLVPCLQRPQLSLLSRRDQITALLVFVFLGLVEEATVSHAGLLNERIVAVCAAGLLAGPWVGLGVGVFVTWLAVEYHGLPLGSIATAMLGGGLAGGLLSRWRSKLAQQPLTGFCLTFWNIVVAQWPPLGFRFSFTRGYPADRRDRDRHYVASFRHCLDSGYHRAGTRS